MYQVISYQNSPFHSIFLNQTISTQIIEYLIVIRTDINLQNHYNETPLQIFSTQKTPNLQVLKFMVEKMADINFRSTKPFPISNFCSSDNIDFDIIKYLIEMKAELDHKKSYNNLNALQVVCKNQNSTVKVVQFLVEKNAFINISNIPTNPLFLSCKFNLDFQIIKYLIDQKSDFNLGDNSSPILEILRANNINLDTLKYLVQSKADLNLLNNFLLLFQLFVQGAFAKLKSSNSFWKINLTQT